MGSLLLLASLATLASVGYAACYAVACRYFPFGNCRACKGTGKRHAPIFRKSFRLCTRCAGTGRRVRLGRRLYEYLSAEHRKGTS
jgi:hypothetical protein